MKRVLTAVFASVLALVASTALAQTKPPLKLGGILDMSSLYADITGAGSETAAKMAAEDFGGEVLGRKIEIVAADHLNKADLAANIARDMLDNQGVEMIYDVAASATALAAGEIAKARNIHGPHIDRRLTVDHPFGKAHSDAAGLTESGHYADRTLDGTQNASGHVKAGCYACIRCSARNCAIQI